MDGWMRGWEEGWMDGRMDGWTVGRIADEWIGRLVYGKMSSEVLNQPKFPQNNVELI